MFLRRIVTWDTVTPLFLVFCDHLDFCLFLFARFPPDMVDEFLYPLYVYHLFLFLPLSVSHEESCSGMRNFNTM